MAPFSLADARAVYEAYVRDAEGGSRIILGAFLDGNLVGTAQLVLAVPPNQPHRAEVASVLVHRSARRRGIAQRLMEQLEHEARAEGRTLLVLDAVSDGDAARLYDRLGWNDRRRDPGLRALPGRTVLRHDRLLEARLLSAP